MTRTKDEQFVIKLYELAVKEGDIEHTFDRYEVGQSIQQSTRMVDTICALLIRANFIKKAEDNQIYLTPHGEQLVLRLRDEK